MKRKSKQKKLTPLSGDHQAKKADQAVPLSKTTPENRPVSRSDFCTLDSIPQANPVATSPKTDRLTRSHKDFATSCAEVKSLAEIDTVTFPAQEQAGSRAIPVQDVSHPVAEIPPITIPIHDKNDSGHPMNPRRMNKRELKALLKQTRRSHAALDEQSVATFDSLATEFKACAIDPNPPVPKPIMIAPAAAKPLTPSVNRRGHPGARRGRRGGRGGRKPAIDTPPPAAPPICASWMPLMLPASQPPRQEASYSVCTPWLNLLSESRVNRFLNNMQAILPQSATLEKDATPAKSKLETIVQRFPLPSDNMAAKPAIAEPLTIPQAEPASTSLTVQDDSRGRPFRGRPFRGKRGSRWSGKSRPFGGSHGLNEGASLRTVVKPKTKPRIPRELRGLVTWDALIAQQKRLQSTQASESVPTSKQMADVTLVVAEDLLAQATTGDEATRQFRRTRQSSGSALPGHRAHSETASLATTTVASEFVDSEGALPQKSADMCSTSRSIISTASSSITSELHTVVHAPLTAHQTAKMLDKTIPNSANVTIDQSSETLACKAQYSPISVDHESVTLSRDSTVPTLKSRPGRRGRRGRRGRGFFGRRPSHHASSKSLDGDSASSVNLSAQDDPSSTAVPLSGTVLVTSKRRRSSTLSPSEGRTIFLEDASSTAEQQLSRVSPVRGSVLPPRKRYKIGLDSDNDVTLEDAEEASGGGHANSEIGSNDRAAVGVVDEQTTSPQTHRRGRPPRNAANPPVEPATGHSASTNTTDRPKREAAVIGFASLVSANLNNNTRLQLDSPGNRPTEAEVQSSHETGSTTVETPVCLAPTPRGRGRPRKTKGPELSIPEKSSHPVARKRSTVGSSPGEKTFQSSYSSSGSSESHDVTGRVLKEGVDLLRQSNDVITELTESPTEPASNLESNGMREKPANAIRPLPKHNSLFKGYLLTDTLPLDMQGGSFTNKGPVFDILFRFLNEPDPDATDERFASPILYLPAPEHYPEFYRFVISSYSGTPFRAHFTHEFMKRLFPSTPNPNSSVPPVEAVYGVEFPCLCLASIVNWLNPTERERLDKELDLSPAEKALVAIDLSNAETDLPLLDAAVESVLSVWEAFAGRRSWFGRRVLRLRALYSTIRTQQARVIAEEYNQIVPPLKATAVLNMPSCRLPLAGTKKKSDRRALERGAEVIRCLCGFRVEGGHIMVQCDHCASWQHLPCLWWALNQPMLASARPENHTAELCRAVLHAAQAVGTSESSVEPSVAMAADLPYFCPVCLGLTGLTLEYPRSLSAAMAMDDLESVFDLQETTVAGEREFWSLTSVDGTQQIRTDDYAFISRSVLDMALRAASTTGGRIDFKAPLQLSSPPTHSAQTAYDRVIFRIYRLWRDKSENSWMEGGLFLRPYDLPSSPGPSGDTVDQPARLWHRREVIYDETSRLILPLSAWLSRCIVLSPSAYRAGRPADTLDYREALQFVTCSTAATGEAEQTVDQLVFVCDKLFERVVSGADQLSYRFDEISPEYLKINTRPYCFLRKSDAPTGRTTLTRTFTAAQLMEQDRGVSANENAKLFKALSVDDNTSGVQSKGQKLARVVDWLEKKRHLDINSTESSSTVKMAPISQDSHPKVSARHHRGRPRGSRGRGRGTQTKMSRNVPNITPTEPTEQSVDEAAKPSISMSPILIEESPERKPDDISVLPEVSPIEIVELGDTSQPEMRDQSQCGLVASAPPSPQRRRRRRSRKRVVSDSERVQNTENLSQLAINVASTSAGIESGPFDAVVHSPISSENSACQLDEDSVSAKKCHSPVHLVDLSPVSTEQVELDDDFDAARNISYVCETPRESFDCDSFILLEHFLNSSFSVTAVTPRVISSDVYPMEMMPCIVNVSLMEFGETPKVESVQDTKDDDHVEPVQNEPSQQGVPATVEPVKSTGTAGNARCLFNVENIASSPTPPVDVKPPGHSGDNDASEEHADANATPILDEPGTCGDTAKPSQISTEILKCISGSLECIPFATEDATAKHDYKSSREKSSRHSSERSTPEARYNRESQHHRSRSFYDRRPSSSFDSRHRHGDHTRHQYRDEPYRRRQDESFVRYDHHRPPPHHDPYRHADRSARSSHDRSYCNPNYPPPNYHKRRNYYGDHRSSR